MVTAASESTRREYAARMNRVVDHIQCHLADSLDLEQLAAVACFSPFHFHRLFRVWMGETLQAFVHRLRQPEMSTRNHVVRVGCEFGMARGAGL